MKKTAVLKPPFPWFGGKRQVAPEVWRRFGWVPNYVEPFFGSGAVLLGCPHPAKRETVNDKDGFLTNFWRALQADPDGVAKHADKMVNEVDLTAWQDWLYSDMSFQDKMWEDPEYYDIKRAGVWVWGVCSTIADAWKPKKTGKARVDLSQPSGIHSDRMCLGAGGLGVGVRAYFNELSLRIRRVRVMSGEWDRVTSYTVTTKHGLTAMFLDPPYLDNCTAAYNHNDDVRAAVREYCIKRGNDPLLRIALCCYEGEQDMPDGWVKYSWETRGGYSGQSSGTGRENAKRERIWFSPHCLGVEKRGFFE